MLGLGTRGEKQFLHYFRMTVPLWIAALNTLGVLSVERAGDEIHFANVFEAADPSHASLDTHAEDAYSGKGNSRCVGSACP